MISASVICNSFKLEFLDGVHQAGDEYRVALYTNAASLDEDTTAYTTSGEVVGAGYTAGGQVLSGRTTVLDPSGVAYLDFADPLWPVSTLVGRGALIFNASRGNAAIAVLNFGGDVSSANGPFTVILPAPGPGTALIRIS
jgi:hypothetical protein